MPTSMVLRFRDLVAPTIQAHQQVIDQYRYVWWGWWNKSNEKIPRATFALFKTAIEEDGSLTVFLLDSGQNKLYKAVLVEIDESGTETPKPCKEADRTPSYYREFKYKAWFKFTSITEVGSDEIRQWSYDEVNEFLEDPASPEFQDKRVFSIQEMLNRSHRTIYFVQPYQNQHQDYEYSPPPQAPPANFISKPIFTDSAYLLHLSDLHFSQEHHAFALQGGQVTKKLSTLIIEDMRREYGDEPPAAVIISGDLTWAGLTEEFELARDFVFDLMSAFSLTRNHFVIVPGNHDIQWAPQDAGSYDGTNL
ncbi:MAG TPA: metallophosphoesterase [Blastocatellia bacterium]